jgi:NADH-quinone oxidoreductase subunit K
MTPLSHVLSLSVLLFGLGAVGVLVRRNLVVVLMCLELMLGAAGLALVAFARHHGDESGQAFAVFVLLVGAAQLSVGVGIVTAHFLQRGSLNAEEASRLKW